MNKYKVEFVQTEKFIIDIKAKNETAAIKKAIVEWNKIAENGTAHYHQEGDTETKVGTIYDVTNTDDPFDPLNK